ncbi:MAG: hypothetical protein LC797_11325 [Chloroflexi bacterium]|nr:hypothetical protein [Chloroflexota bacterium]
MQTAGVHSRVRAMVALVTPGLRVVGLVYTGLGGMLAMVLVVSVALVPVAPALRQAVEPARQAIGYVAQPPSDGVAGVLGGAPTVEVRPHMQFVTPSDVSLFLPAITPDASAADSQPESSIEVSLPRVVAAAAPRPRAHALPEQSSAPQAIDEVVGLEPTEISSRALAPVAVPVPTETAAQVKARLDIANQAAIDSARATQARAKADADAANETAIAARKANATAAALATRVPLTTPIATATAVPTIVGAATPITPVNVRAAAAAPATPLASGPVAGSLAASSKDAANAANQAAIDAAKAGQARARAQADAANQAALAAASAAKSSSKKPTSPATIQPAPSLASPPALPNETNASADDQARSLTLQPGERIAAGVDAAEQRPEFDEASLEDAPIDEATTFEDGAPA